MIIKTYGLTLWLLSHTKQATSDVVWSRWSDVQARCTLTAHWVMYHSSRGCWMLHCGRIFSSVNHSTNIGHFSRTFSWLSLCFLLLSWFHEIIGQNRARIHRDVHEYLTYCRRSTRWDRSGFHIWRVAVNVSVQEFQSFSIPVSLIPIPISLQQSSKILLWKTCGRLSLTSTKLWKDRPMNTRQRVQGAPWSWKVMEFKKDHFPGLESHGK